MIYILDFKIIANFICKEDLYTLENTSDTLENTSDVPVQSYYERCVDIQTKKRGGGDKIK